MTASRTLQRWTTIAALFVLTGPILLPGVPARAAVGEALLPPTPLVLKDGRIANVSIHVLPFDSGNGELAGNAAASLAELTATVATDCFLTAQVIGHVSSREVADNETLAAHRLARARADAVQASLIGGGLPAKAIASVWDWQFLVREPRATLWVFRLVQGEDCEGLPLDGDAQLVAQADAGQAAPPQTEAASAAEAAPASEAPAREVAARAEAPPPPSPEPAEVDRATSGSDLAGMVGSAVAAESAPADQQDARQAAPARPGQGQGADAPAGASTAAAPPPDQADRVLPAGPAADTVPTLTRPLPAQSPSQPAAVQAAGDDRARADAVAADRVAAVEPGPATTGAAAPSDAAAKAADTAAVQQAAAPPNPEREGKVEWGADNVVITFATNSSYFPPGTTRRLGALLGGMTAGERYRVRLEVGVSGSDTVVGATTAEEARRYNTWLAERRLQRVREWLDENAADRQVEIEPAFQADNSSRRVVVRVAPVS